MTAVSLFDVLAGDGTTPPSDDPQATAQLTRLAEKLIDAALADVQRIREYEEQFGLSGYATEGAGLEMTRSIYRLFEDWATEARQVLARARQLRSSGSTASNVEALEDAFGRVSARLKLTPEMIGRATEQVRQGNVVPAEELRNELRARLRA